MRALNMGMVLAALSVTAGCGDDSATDGGLATDGAPADGNPGDASIADGGLFGLTEREWTFVPLRGMRCMNGTTTGFGVSPVFDSRRVVIHLQGGGSCFNDPSCADVVNPDGYDGSAFDRFAARTETYGLLRRDTGPFADATQIWVPYCTGDLHSGSNADGYGGREQVGHDNIGALLNRIAPVLQGRVDEIFVTGASAGGAGTPLTFIQVRERFGDGVAVHLLNDSGPFLGDDVLTPCLQTVFRETWALAETLPAGCGDCNSTEGGGISNLYEHLSATYPESRFGLVMSRGDGTLRGGYGFGFPSCDAPTVPMDGAVYESGIDALADRLELLPNFRVFVIDNSEHVFVNEPDLARTVDGVSLRDWTDGLVTGGAAFVNARP